LNSPSRLPAPRLKPRTADSKSKPARAAAETEAKAKPARRLSYAEQKERDRTIRRQRRRVEELEAEIADIESQVKATEDEIAAGVTTDDIFTRHADLQKKLENTMSLWELASLELDSLSE